MRTPRKQSQDVNVESLAIENWFVHERPFEYEYEYRFTEYEYDDTVTQGVALGWYIAAFQAAIDAAPGTQPLLSGTRTALVS